MTVDDKPGNVLYALFPTAEDVDQDMLSHWLRLGLSKFESSGLPSSNSCKTHGLMWSDTFFRSAQPPEHKIAIRATAIPIDWQLLFPKLQQSKLTWLQNIAYK